MTVTRGAARVGCLAALPGGRLRPDYVGREELKLAACWANADSLLFFQLLGVRGVPAGACAIGPLPGVIDVRDKTMTIPVLMAVDDNKESLGIPDGALCRQYGQNYRIISDASPAAALGRLRELRAACRKWRW